jgi:hypothetical protein
MKELQISQQTLVNRACTGWDIPGHGLHTVYQLMFWDLTVPVELFGEALVLGIVLHQLVDDPGEGGHRDPLPGMHAAVQPHGRLVAATIATYLGR